MKRFVLTFLLLLALPGYDLSAFEKLGDDANSVLEQLGLDDFDFETVTALDAKSCVQVLGRLVRQNIQTPLRALLSVLSFTLLSAFLTGFSGSGLLGQNSSVYSTASALVIAALIGHRVPLLCHHRHLRGLCVCVLPGIFGDSNCVRQQPDRGVHQHAAAGAGAGAEYPVSQAVCAPDQLLFGAESVLRRAQFAEY